MISHRAVVFMLAGLALGSTATAQGGTSNQPEISGAPATAPDTDRLVCKYQLKTGTRFKERSCRTVKQWEAMREQQRRDAHEMIDRPQVETRRD
jgi:hypothetical protein